MNDKLNRFTQQLGDNAPLAPDLENQTFSTTSEVRGPATGLRVGLALGVVAALAVGLVVANRDDSPTAVVPANELNAEQSAAGIATISKAVASVLPDSYVVASVEHPQEQQLNITAASPDGVVLFIKAILTSSGAVVSDTEPQGTGSVAELTVPVPTTVSMTGATVGDVSDSTVHTPAVVGIARDKDLSVTIERFALDDQSLDDSLTQKVHDALLALNSPEQTLQEVIDSIILIPTQPGFASIEESTTFIRLTLTQATSFADGSFSYVMFTASDGSSAKGMMICLPATAIADSVTTDDNGVIVAIHSNETTTCIVWLVDAQSIGATEADVAALAAEELDYSPLVSDVTPMTTSTTYEVPVLTEAPVLIESPIANAALATTYPPSTDAPVDTLAVTTTSTIVN